MRLRKRMAISDQTNKLVDDIRERLDNNKLFEAFMKTNDLTSSISRDIVDEKDKYVKDYRLLMYD